MTSNVRLNTKQLVVVWDAGLGVVALLLGFAATSDEPTTCATPGSATCAHRPHAADAGRHRGGDHPRVHGHAAADPNEVYYTLTPDEEWRAVVALSGRALHQSLHRATAASVAS